MTLPWFIVGCAVVLIGITKSGFGSGIGLMIVPMTAIAMSHTKMGEEAALGFMLPLLICGDFIAIAQYRKLFDRRTVLRMLPATALGVILGSLLLKWIGDQRADLAAALLRVEIGLEAILLVALHWWRVWRGEQHKLLPEPLRSNVTGGFAGVSSTLAHAAGPIFAMYLLPLKFDRRIFVGTTAVYFFLLNTMKLPAYWWNGQLASAPVTFSLQFVPLVLVGAGFGFWLNQHLTDKLFSKIVYLLTFLLGWYVLVDGVIGVFRRI